ncbi:MAG: histidine kinase [Bacteroidia bacterium]|jgi:ligand-binding sensor domain-containing protein
MIRSLFIRFLLTVAAGFPSLLYAQLVLMPHYTTKDGLPSSTIYDITQDADGYIWIATEAGVSRFDGKTFRNFTLDDGLSDIETLTITADSKGRLWFLGFNGTVCYWYKNKIYNSTTDTLLKKITSLSAFLSLFEDSENRLWFISQNQIILMDQNKVSYPPREQAYPFSIMVEGKKGPYFLNNYKPYTYRNKQFFNVRFQYTCKINGAYKTLMDGSVLFASPDGIVHQNDTLQELIIPFDKKLKESPQHDIEFSADSTLWLTTQIGLVVYDLKAVQQKPKIILENKTTNRLLEDREGNLWIGTLDDGIFMLPVWAKHIRLLQDPDKHEDLQCYAVYKQNKVTYYGTTHGRVMRIENNITTPILAEDDTMEVGEIHKIIGDGTNLWFASGSKVLHYDARSHNAHLVYSLDNFGKLKYTIGNKGLCFGNNTLFIARNYLVSEVVATCSGNIKKSGWLKGRKAIAGCLSKNIVDVHSRIFSAYWSKSGTLWFGARPGLYARKGKTVTLHADEDELLRSRINTFAETDDSTLLIGTYGHGLLFYKNGKVVQRLTKNEGLTNDICKKIFVFKNQIYVATPSGVSIIPYYRGKTGEIIRLNANNILPFNEVNDVYVDDDEILVATSNGLLSIQPSVIGQIKTHTPDLHLEEIFVNGEKLEKAEDFKLRYSQNSIHFRFTGIHFQLPKEVYYQYRLSTKQDWQTTRNNLLEFPFLPAGDYTFQLQTCIAGSPWSALKSVTFTIQPPYWQTWWFYLLVAVSLIFAIAAIVRRRLHSIRQQQNEKIKLERQITALEQEALQSMMNPHFIFNVMNSIQHFINNNDKAEANKYLSNFAKLIRMNLAISYKKYIPLEEEIDYLQLYLSFEKLRFGEKMHYAIEVDPAIDTHEIHIAVMMIQPFLENAIWHGILPLDQPGSVILKITRPDESTLHISITDTGAGIGDEYLQDASILMESKSHGIQITIRRLALITRSTGHALQLSYRHVHPSLPVKGTCVEFVLPIVV